MFKVRALALLAALCLCATSVFSAALYKLKEFKPHVSCEETSYTFPFLVKEIKAASYDANGHLGDILSSHQTQQIISSSLRGSPMSQHQ